MKTYGFLFSVLLGISSLNAQSLFDAPTHQTEATGNTSLHIQGYTRAVLFANETFNNLSRSFAETALQARSQLGISYMRADLRFRNGLINHQEVLVVEPKELYVGFNTGMFDVTAGYQIISWGRTDGFNPTNNINPKNYFFLSENPDDQWLSNFMLRCKFRPTAWMELDVIGIPHYKSSVYEYQLFNMGENVTFTDPIVPLRTLSNGTLAARLNVELPTFGAALSWFRGYDPFHGYNIQRIDWSLLGVPMITNAAESFRKTALGADVAIPLGSNIVRMELARNITDNPENKMHIPSSDWSYVAAFERNIAGITFIAQYIGKYVSNFNPLAIPQLTNPLDPLAQVQYANARIEYENRQLNRKIFQQQEATHHALSLTLAHSFAFNTWHVECTGFYNITTGEWLLRPTLKIDLSDQMQINLGANYMYGAESTLFDYSSDIMNGFFAALRVSY